MNKILFGFALIFSIQLHAEGLLDSVGVTVAGTPVVYADICDKNLTTDADILSECQKRLDAAEKALVKQGITVVTRLGCGIVSPATDGSFNRCKYKSTQGSLNYR